MIILNKLRRPLTYNRVMLLPGANVLDVIQTKAVQEPKTFRKINANPRLQIVEEKVTSLDGLNTESAVEIVVKVFNKAALKGFQSKSKDPVVKKAIIAQIKLIDDQVKAKAKDEEED